MKQPYESPYLELLPLPAVETLSLSGETDPSLPFVPFNGGSMDDYF